MKDKKHRVRLVIYSAATLIIMLAIFIFSGQSGEVSRGVSQGFLSSLLGSALEELLPGLTEKGIDYDIRKYAHMFEYFCLGVSCFLLMDELLLKRGKRAAKAAGLGWGLCFLYACSDEWHQTFVPGRAGKFSDVLVDSVGFTLAILFMLLLFALIRKKRPQRR